MVNSGNRRWAECSVCLIFVLLVGSGTNIVGSERSRGTVLTNGWLMFLRLIQVCLYIGIMVFFRSVFFMKSRMNREVHVWFCERCGGAIPPTYSTLFYTPVANIQAAPDMVECGLVIQIIRPGACVLYLSVCNAVQ